MTLIKSVIKLSGVMLFFVTGAAALSPAVDGGLDASYSCGVQFYSIAEGLKQYQISGLVKLNRCADGRFSSSCGGNYSLLFNEASSFTDVLGYFEFRPERLSDGQKVTKVEQATFVAGRGRNGVYRRTVTALSGNVLMRPGEPMSVYAEGSTLSSQETTDLISCSVEAISTL